MPTYFEFLKGLAISVETLSHRFGPIKDGVSMPYLSVHVSYKYI